MADCNWVAAAAEAAAGSCFSPADERSSPDYLVVDGEGPGDGAVFAWTGRSPRGSHKSWVVVFEAFLQLKPVQ